MAYSIYLYEWWQDVLASRICLGRVNQGLILPAYRFAIISLILSSLCQVMVSRWVPGAPPFGLVVFVHHADC